MTLYELLHNSRYASLYSNVTALPDTIQLTPSSPLKYQRQGLPSWCSG